MFNVFCDCGIVNTNAREFREQQKRKQDLKSQVWFEPSQFQHRIQSHDCLFNITHTMINVKIDLTRNFLKKTTFLDIDN